MPSRKFLDTKYGDFGGYQGLIDIINTNMKYRDKIQRITRIYPIGPDQAKNWVVSINRDRREINNQESG